MPVVIHVIAPIPDQGNDSPQKEIDLLIVAQRLEGAAAHQPVIRVVIHHVHSKHFHHFVKAARGGALEKAVGIPLVPDAVNDVAPFFEFGQEAVQGVDIVLQVRIQADRAVGLLLRRHQAGEQSVLMPPVMRELEARAQRVFLAEAADQLPSLVLAAVIHQQKPAVFIRVPRGDEGLHLLGQAADRLGQYRLLIIAGNHQIHR